MCSIIIIYYNITIWNSYNIKEDRINEIIGEIKKLLRSLGNSSVIDYEEEKKIVEPFYTGVFKVICFEIYYTGKSTLLEFCKASEIDKSFLERKIKWEEIKMIAKSEFSDVISGVVLLLEKQVEGMERAEIIDFLEALNTSDDKSLPVIIYGKKGQLLFKDIGRGTTKLIDSDSLNEVREHLALRKAS